ncbi:MAG TPA: PHP domain-containing protein [Chloroflexota bacterium]|nr:PHP domain-containing protein [Chloroflexota bacterium]
MTAVDPATTQPAPATPPPVDPPPWGWSAVDLHVHTTASDGRLTPAETVALAVARGLSVLSLTDHDSTEGVGAAIAAARGSRLRVIPGVEMNTDTPQGEAHVLGYFVDHEDTDLQRRLADRRRARMERGLGIVTKLKAIGIEVSWERVQEIAGAAEGGAVGRPHLALALQEAGFVKSTQEAFERYIGRGGPAYVEYEKLAPEEATQIIRRAGGLAALAHPSTIEDLDRFLQPLIEAGLEGLECYYGAYPEATVLRLVTLAERLGLSVTGGSDYHGSEQVTYNATLGGTPVPMSVVEGLEARHAARA